MMYILHFATYNIGPLAKNMIQFIHHVALKIYLLLFQGLPWCPIFQGDFEGLLMRDFERVKKSSSNKNDSKQVGCKWNNTSHIRLIFNCFCDCFGGNILEKVFECFFLIFKKFLYTILLKFMLKIC
jgi:hypothetical protein